MTEKEYRSGFVSVVGRPNVGKSTLINHLVGQKVAIVSDKPQTTRHRILGVLTLPEAQIVFVDTPGIHKPRHRLGEYLVTLALGALKGVDLVLFLSEATSPPGAGDYFILEQLKKAEVPVILVLNKIDLISKPRLLPLIDLWRQEHDFAAIVPVSALTGENLERLVQEIVEHLPPGPQYFPPEVTTSQPPEFVVAELIREKVLHLTHEEVPHGVAVVVEEMASRRKDLVYLRATIYVERESHKKIIIGAGGQMLRQIGQKAREEIEAFLGKKVYLDLWVKVKEKWRRDDVALRQLGYKPEE
ncbi:GTP-binding protein Era [Ammonifex degensii KC4]|uniref:GTPase Era n=1 Tax=Ammonifex degensii (strain DSM 10501 / KC4) TaxID=429009 RepID=C9RAN4_AMMDK|nr:GTPase Era [Ammonifex degensii]ACX51311.1 GTP-binding protein Era [Ammonifex degensii KC4]